MQQLTLTIGAVLTLAILFLIFRLSNIMGTLRGDQNPWEGSANKINAGLMIAFLLLLMGGFGWYHYYAHSDLLPQSSSVHGVETDHLFNLATGVILIPFVILNILLFYAAWRFRFNKNKRANFYPENSKLELLWTVVPSIVFTLLILKGTNVWEKIKAKAPDDAEVIEVMGYQFAWKVRYPGNDNILGKYNFKFTDANNEFGMDLRDKATFDDFDVTEIHVPKDKPVLLKIRSKDVIHSFFAPHFRLKMDAVPGMGTSFCFVPTISTEEMRVKLGKPDFNYEVACAEVCGRGHFAMRMILVVDEPEVYEKWKNSQESWLKHNPEYMTQIPDPLKEVARIKAKMEPESKIIKASLVQ